MQQLGYNTSSSYVQRTRARLDRIFTRFDSLYSRSDMPAGICAAQYTAIGRDKVSLRKGEVSA